MSEVETGTRISLWQVFSGSAVNERSSEGWRIHRSPVRRSAARLVTGHEAAATAACRTSDVSSSSQWHAATSGPSLRWLLLTAPLHRQHSLLSTFVKEQRSVTVLIISSLSLCKLRHRRRGTFNPLMPTVAAWVEQLQSILCQTSLSHHL